MAEGPCRTQMQLFPLGHGSLIMAFPGRPTEVIHSQQVPGKTPDCEVPVKASA